MGSDVDAEAPLGEDLGPARNERPVWGAGWRDKPYAVAAPEPRWHGGLLRFHRISEPRVCHITRQAGVRAAVVRESPGEVPSEAFGGDPVRARLLAAPVAAQGVADAPSPSPSTTSPGPRRTSTSGGW